MKSIVIFITALIMLSQTHLNGLTIPASQMHHLALAFPLKADSIHNYSCKIEDIDFSQLADWFICDSDSAFKVEYPKRLGIDDGKFWTMTKQYSPDEIKRIKRGGDYSSYSSYYQANVVFRLYTVWHYEMYPHFILVTSWIQVNPSSESLKYIGAQVITTRFDLDRIIIGSVTFPDQSILLALSNLSGSRVCFLRGITLTDFSLIYAYKWDNSDKFVTNRYNDAETTYICGFEYIKKPMYQIYEFIAYDHAVPMKPRSYIKLDKVESRIIDLWDLARKRFHIKGKFDRYK
jgi:hypothetical protein